MTEPPDPTDGLDTDPEPVGGLPTSGTAQFAGAMIIGLERAGASPGARTSLTGDLTVDVSFGNPAVQVTGNARDFAATGDVPLEGVLFLTLGVIDRAAKPTDPTFSGTASGSLREGANAYLLYGQFSGDFQGDGQSAVKGLVFGNARNGNNQTLFDGTFQAGR